jgi:hypothetical protein
MAKEQENIHKPGSIAEETAFYEEIGSDGSKTGKKVKVNQGKQFPPTRKRGQGYVKSGK